MDPTLWLALLFLVAAGALLWWRDTTRLRQAAARIDARFKVLAVEPQWTPLDDASDIPPPVIERLDRFDEALATLGFVPLGRLREGYPATGKTIGVRTVLVDPGRSTAAVYACAHKLPELIAFRSFVSRVGEIMLVSTDARSVTPDPSNQRFTRYAKDASIETMHAEHGRRLATIGAAPRRFATLEDYVDLQARMWREGNAARRDQNYVIDLGVLRKLAPPNLSEGRLKRLHGEILRLNANRR